MTRPYGWFGAALLSLPAAILAHVLWFGGSHVLGGSYHSEVVDAAMLLGALGGAAIALVALCTSSSAQNGSILAARLARYLPSWPALAVGTSACLWLIERLETPDGALTLMALPALALAVLVVAFAAHTFVRALAAIVVKYFGGHGHAGSLGIVASFGLSPVAALDHLSHRRLFLRAPPRS